MKKHNAFTFAATARAKAAKPYAILIATLAMNAVSLDAMADVTGGSLTTVTGATTSILSTINTILRPLSLIAIIVCGAAGAFGKMEWGTVAKVMVGVLIANSATTIVDYVGGGTAQS